MLRIQRPTKRTEYILEEDRDSSAPTVFVLRPLTWDQVAEVGSASPLSPEQAQAHAAIFLAAQREGRELTVAELNEINKIAPMNAQYLRALTHQMAIAARYGVAEIRNAIDFEGAPLTINAVEFVEHGRAEHVRELGGEVMRISQFAEDAIKK